MSESERHHNLILSGDRFFTKRGYGVKKNEPLNMDGHRCFPDLIIYTWESVIPFECGTIGQGLPELYLRYFGMYFHCDKMGNVKLVLDGESHYYVKLPFATLHPKKLIIKKKRGRNKRSICAFCGKVITGKLVLIGGRLMHKRCGRMFLIECRLNPGSYNQ